MHARAVTCASISFYELLYAVRAQNVYEHEVLKILEFGTRPPATGIIVFAWGSLKEQPGKLKELWRFYHQLAREKNESISERAL
jgi:hypothetical protein